MLAKTAQTQTASDRLLSSISDALAQMHRDQFDAEMLSAASEVTGIDMFAAWQPSFAYLPPQKQGDEYHVTVYATGVCENSPTDRLDVAVLQTRLRSLVGSECIFVDDYFDVFEWDARPRWAAE